ncbi:MAG TPA: hypothetical protein DCW68_03685 [Rhodospirillaceae bacterium]|nr:MAG: hypothetical protein A2018_07765 [Alphaproteobacteria bacterium GWF2_58_20]HAU29195.1 hypothetical protein [Rhodospirillaceae bacterium]
MSVFVCRRSGGVFWGVLFLSCLAILSLSGCSGVHDPELGLNRDAYRNMTDPVPDAFKTSRKEAPPIPDLSPTIARPAMPLLTPNRTVSLSVTSALSLKDVMFELARQAEVDIEIDPRIAGGVDFSAHNRPFLDVIDRLCDLAGLRFRIRNNVVRVEIDDPYVFNYEVPYLSIIRQTRSNIGVSTDVVTPGSSAGSGDTRSTASISGESDSNFFGELETGLKALLANTTPAGLSATRPADQPAVVLHKQTGIISVFGTLKQHQAVAEYLKPLVEASMAQVQIDARIIEVNLDDRYKSGVDWTFVMQQGTIYTLGSTLTNFNDPSPLNNTFQATIDGSDVDLLVNLIQKFGTTRTLSSPRATVLNNQSAILKVARNYVYFDVQVDRETTTDTTTSNNLPLLTVSSDIRTIPIGLVMAVQPSVDMRTNEIVLTVRPTVTELDSTVSDPAVQYINSTLDPNAVRVESQIPVVRVREIDSVLRLQSGEVAVLGGLMQDKSVLDDEGLPGLGETPVLGDLVTKREKLRDTTEMVVLLRAQVLKNASSGVTDADRHLYKTFVRDPRPFNF